MNGENFVTPIKTKNPVMVLIFKKNFCYNIYKRS